MSGKGALAETDPQAVGVVGTNGGVPATRAVVAEADLVLFIGCRAGSVTTERWTVPAPGIKVIHIDLDAAVPGTNYPTEVAIHADAKLALEALGDGVKAALAHKRAKPFNGFGGKARAAAAWKQKLADFAPLAASKDRPIRPEAVIAALSDALSDSAIVGGRSGHALPLCRGAFPAAPRRAAFHHQPGARGPGLCAGGRDGGRRWQARRAGGGADGRRFVRLLLW